MAIGRRIEHMQPQINSEQTEAPATYAIVPGERGERWLQIDTYGSAERKLVGKKSQSIRLTTEAIAELKAILARHFPDT